MSFSTLFPVYLVLMNALAFVLMGLDKSLARRHLRRIPEKTLFLPVLLGGSLGGILGMSVFRHKTRHSKFTLGFPLILAVQLLLAWVIWR